MRGDVRFFGVRTWNFREFCDLEPVMSLFDGEV